MMKSNTSEWTDDAVPYICWDRHWTVADIRRRLATSEGVERHRLMAWLMRELKTSEVWFFLTGGSALGLFHLDHRVSYDVDLFSQEHPDWLELDGVN